MSNPNREEAVPQQRRRLLAGGMSASEPAGRQFARANCQRARQGATASTLKRRRAP